MNKTGDAKNSSRLKKRLLKRLATQLSIFTVATISAFMMFFFVSRFLFGLYTWEWSDRFYQFAKNLERNYIFVVLIALLAGGLVIYLEHGQEVWHSWMKYLKLQGNFIKIK